MIASPLDSRLYRTLQAFVPGPVIRLLPMEIVGEHHLPRHGPVVLASNHLSNLDPFILGVASPRQIHFMAKAEIWKVPLVGRLVETLGSFPVHRGEADREAVRRGLDVLQAGAVLGIFPEGHRQPEGHLGQAQPGVALFSLRPGVKTVPVAVVGTSRIMQGWRPTRAKVTVTFGPPLDLAGVAGSKGDQHREVTGRLMGALAGLLRQTWPPESDHVDEGLS